MESLRQRKNVCSAVELGMEKGRFVTRAEMAWSITMPRGLKRAGHPLGGGRSSLDLDLGATHGYHFTSPSGAPV